MSDHAILAAWPAKPAATRGGRSRHAVSASAGAVVVGRVRPGGVEGVQIRVVNSGRRAGIVRLATRALKALRASSIPLRPRCARLTALTARVATRSRATIDGRTVLDCSLRFSQVCQPLEQLFSTLQLKAIRHET